MSVKKLVKIILARVLGKKVAKSLITYCGIVKSLYIRNRAPIRISTSHPILTISSDDWGSVFLGKESTKHIRELLNVLKKHIDVRGKPAVLNAYIVTTLPDFDFIAKSGFKEYVFYPTYRDNPDIIKAWMDGYKVGVFCLEFHARDHFNHKSWLNYLQRDNEYFMHGFLGGKVRYKDNMEMMKRMPELWYFSREYIDGEVFPSNTIPLDEQNHIISDGVKAFESMFGFKPLAFVAPGYCFDEATQFAASNNHISYIETTLEYIMAVDGNGHPICNNVQWGERLTGGIIVLIRNVHYEPDWLESGWHESDEKSVKANKNIALVEIKRAFRRKEPVILSTHAQNYIGKPEKVSLNIEGLEDLLKQITSRWTNVHFASIEEIGRIISQAENTIDPTFELVLHSKNNIKKPNLILSLFWSMHDFFLLAINAISTGVPMRVI